MDKTALDVIAQPLFRLLGLNDWHAGDQATARSAAREIVAGLGANGYVVVPRHLLDELLDAAWHVQPLQALGWRTRLLDARAAVVEVVGPTT